MNKSMLAFLISTAVLFFGLIAVGITLSVSFAHTKSQILALPLNQVDLSRVSDGTFEGTCDMGAVNSTMQVTVAESRISQLTVLRHKNSKRYPPDAMIALILQTQRLPIDAVSGATLTNRVTLKALEAALGKGVK